MTKEEFLALAAGRYDALQKLNKLGSFYDYKTLRPTLEQEGSSEHAQLKGNRYEPTMEQSRQTCKN